MAYKRMKKISVNYTNHNFCRRIWLTKTRYSNRRTSANRQMNSSKMGRKVPVSKRMELVQPRAEKRIDKARSVLRIRTARAAWQSSWTTKPRPKSQSRAAAEMSEFIILKKDCWKVCSIHSLLAWKPTIFFSYTISLKMWTFKISDGWTDYR